MNFEIFPVYFTISPYVVVCSYLWLVFDIPIRTEYNHIGPMMASRMLSALPTRLKLGLIKPRQHMGLRVEDNFGEWEIFRGRKEEI
jgi:hypothetical protein